MAVASAATLVILAGAFVASHFGAEARARGSVGHSHQVIEQNLALYALVVQAESAERGWLASGDPRLRSAYDRTVAQIPAAEDVLARLVDDNPTQSGRARELSGLIAGRLAILNGRMAGPPPSDVRPALGAGYLLMAQVRSKVDEIALAERRLLARRILAARRVEAFNLAIGLVAALLALLGLLAAIASLTRANRALRRSETETRRARAAESDAAALVGALFANSPDYLFVLDVRDGDTFVIGEINPAMEKALRVRAADIVGRAIDELMTAEQAAPLLAHYRRVRDADRPVLTRDVIPGFRGGPRTWESILAPVKNASGATDRIIGSVRDITERVRTEERLREAQRMEAVGQLTGGVAHDFNNLLQVIRGSLELTQTAVSDQPRVQRWVANAIAGADRAAQLTRQLLAFARRQPLEPQVVQLSRLVGDMSDMLRRALGETIEVETVIGGGLWNTMADPAQVESAILNLALNARDAMPDGGRLTIEIANASLDEAYAREADEVAPGQYVCLAVSDTGVGMSPEVRARVFDPFFTTKAEGKGSGLGLSMVWGFVRQSNGHIRIYSEPGQGTTVRLYLPRTREAPGPLAAPETPPPVRAEGAMVLVVEDEPAVRAAAVAMIQDLGYRCVEAGDAGAALSALEKEPEIALVFSDVVMPGPIPTRSFIERIGQIRPDAPILFTSGYTENAIVHHGRLDEGVNLISKPYSRDALARRLAALLAPAGGSVQSSGSPSALWAKANSSAQSSSRR